jgi:hypothetical protein
MDMLLKLNGNISVPIKKDFLAFYDQYLKYLKKWFDFFDNYCLYEKYTNTFWLQRNCCNFRLEDINLDESYEEFYIRSTLALLLNDKPKETLFC